VESRTKFGSFGRAEVVDGQMDSKERRKIGGNKRRQSRSCGKPAYPQDFVKRLFTKPIILKKNRKNALGLT
jgi:hypothetical protein